MLSYYMTSLGLIPFFTSRAFTPMFASAMLARIAPHWSWIADLPGSQLLSQVPAWAVSNTTLLVLFVLTLVEVGAAKSPEVRELLTLFDTKIKAVSAFLVCFAIVRGNPMELVEHVEKVGVTTQFAWGQSFAYTWAFAIGAMVWFTSVLRNAVFGFLMDIDPDDDLRVQGLLSWMEDGLGFFGVFFVVIMPTAALVAAGSTILGAPLSRAPRAAQQAAVSRLRHPESTLRHPLRVLRPRPRPHSAGRPPGDGQGRRSDGSRRPSAAVADSEALLVLR
ncbi:MAG: hypothetical protein V3T72_13685 [Thermoanaerobaculia bacterium]